MQTHEFSNSNAELTRIIRAVRSRWRARRVLFGAAIALAATIALYALFAWLGEQTGWNARTLFATRISFTAAVIAAFVWLIVRPLLRKVSDEQVALYIEEREPSLRAALLGAVEASAAHENAGYSPALVGRLVDEAVRRCGEIDNGRRIERKSLAQSYAAIGSVAFVAVLFLLSGPAFMRTGLRQMLGTLSAAEAATVMTIAVTPGTDTVPRGADVTITAQLRGFVADNAEIVVRAADSTEVSRWPMTPSPEAGFEFVLFDVIAPVQYYIESGTVRSPIYQLVIVDLPYVNELTLEYIFPAYTGMPPQTVEGGGDIAVPVGTVVHFRAKTTMPVEYGRIRLADARTIRLQKQGDGSLAGSMLITADGLYHIELPGPDSTAVQGSQQYTIAALDDRAPTVSITKPGRDTRVTSVEEVFIEARAQDDYGLARLELVYSVNGGPQKTLPLYQKSQSNATEITAGHTFYLEELDLKPGDFISYFARAVDTNPAKTSKAKTTDIYFLEIRPFGREYRQAEQQGGGGGGGGGQGAEQELSERQREIIAATFNISRDRETYRPQALIENLNTLGLAQGRLRDQVETLAQRMRNRGIMEIDSAFRQIIEILPKAGTEMEVAERWLRRQMPDSALPAEQRALQHLLHAENVYREVQVAQQQQGGGGGGGQQRASDLADLFELELDKLRNQYETVDRGQQQQQAQAEVDETMERLRELARRQQQELERQMRAQQSGQQGGGGSAAQRRLADEVEEQARRLERLARENASPQLQQAAQDLQRAADDMRRAAASGREGGQAQASAAADRIEQARRRLQQQQNQQISSALEQTAERARELADEQRRISSEVDRMGTNPSQQKLQELGQRKERLGQGVAELEKQLDRLSLETRRDQKEASAKLQGAANSIRENSLKEKIRFSRDVINSRSLDYARMVERQISDDFADLTRELENVGGAVSESREQRLNDALDRARRLARSMESLNERTRESAFADTARQQGGQQSGEGTGAERQQQRRGLNQPQGQRAIGREFTAEDIRQWRAESRQRLDEARDLVRELRESGVPTEELEGVIQDLERLDSQRVYADRQNLEKLQADVVRGLMEFEFALRRQIEGRTEKPNLSGSDQVPPAFRRMVEEYYRALSGRKAGSGGNR